MGQAAGCRQDAKDIATALPEDSWQRLSAGEGTKGARLQDWVYLDLTDLDAGDFDLVASAMSISQHVTYDAQIFVAVLGASNLTFATTTNTAMPAARRKDLYVFSLEREHRGILFPPANDPLRESEAVSHSSTMSKKTY